MKLVPTPPGRLKGGKIVYRGKDITNYSDRQMEKLRGKEMSMIFQDPMTSLNPTIRIGRQISEGIKKHEKISPEEARKRSIKLLKEEGISDPERNIKRYPQMYSGGMRQR
jgi:oligopeptide transport system ATP-binding protein